VLIHDGGVKAFALSTDIDAKTARHHDDNRAMPRCNARRARLTNALSVQLNV
jgi:hypothetical protein